MYPPTVPSDTNTNGTPSPNVHPALHNQAAEALTAIIDVLGADPSGSRSTVQEWLEDLDMAVQAPSGPAGGALSGAYPNPTLAPATIAQFDASGTASAAVSDHSGATDPHGDRSAATAALGAHTGLTTAAHGGLVLSTDSRLADQRTPTDGSITNVKVAASAAIAESKLALATDAAAGVGSRRTLGPGLLQAAPGVHVHVESDVTGLSADLTNKANAVHSHSWAFGDGSDGNVTISVDTTQTRDMFYDTLTINAGVDLNTGGFRVYCRTAFINNGRFRNHGRDAVDRFGAAATPTGTLGVGLAGGNGPVGNGVAGARGTVAAGTSGGLSGDGGNGGGGNIGGHQIGFPADSVGFGYINGRFTTSHHALCAVLGIGTGFAVSSSSLVLVGGGQGGSGGGGDGTNQGGGGGGGGGCIVLAAKTVTNNGTIDATGGNGFNSTAGNTGGGGGGGGGVVFLTYTTKTAAGTVTVAGGLGANGRGTGTAGQNGGAGVIYEQAI